MRLMLSSFGLSHLTLRGNPRTGIFDRMPPVAMTLLEGGVKTFSPDYASLLLSDEVIIDTESWERVSGGYCHPSFSAVSDLLKELKRADLLRVEDYASVLHSRKDLLDDMLVQDMINLDQWIGPLQRAIESWQRFLNILDENLRIAATIPGTDEGSTFILQSFVHNTAFLPKESITANFVASGYSRLIEEALTHYLAMTHANLVLSYIFDARIVDWADFAPFYRRKLLGVGDVERFNAKSSKKLRQLFDIFVPTSRKIDPKAFVAVMRDRRIIDLREFVRKAALEGLEIDRSLIIDTFEKVLEIKSKVDRLRRVVAWISLPLDLLPFGGVLQHGLSEGLGSFAEAHFTKDFRWFLIFNEINRMSSS